MVKIISFDLDGTLITKKYSDLVWLEGLPGLYSKEKNIPLDRAKQILFKKYDEVGDQRVEWYDISYWFKRFELKSSWKKLLEKYSYAVEPYSESGDVLDELSRDSDLILSSNAKKEFIDIELRETGFKKYFKKIFSSTSDFDCVKKTSSFYTKICDYIDVQPDEVVHVGDHKKFDYNMPKKVGIKSFFLDRKNKNDEAIDSFFVVKNLKEFLDRIKQK
ncbi:MAG: HAD family hydrolase [Candidatus Thermoplasmatota archaeon]